MKSPVVIAVALCAVIVAGAWYFLVRMDTESVAVQKQDGLQEERQSATHRAAKLGVEFSYPSGPSGYVLEERNSASDTEGPVSAFIFYREADRVDIPEGGEGAPVISILVFKNTEKQLPRAWAEEHIAYSNINLAYGEVTQAVVKGADAIRYMADGLYASENVIVAHGEYMYVITGEFLDADSALRRDFALIVESIRFIPQSDQE